MQQRSSFEIVPVRSANDLAAVAALFEAYAASLEVDLAYQDFTAELASLPGRYAPPEGELLLARDPDGRPIGCAALRPMKSEGCCEMKRLYVSPRARGLGLGKALVEAMIGAAERIGYCEMRLDTLPSMTDAQALYRRFGFEIAEPYYATPVAGTLFMRRMLGRLLGVGFPGVQEPDPDRLRRGVQEAESGGGSTGEPLTRAASPRCARRRGSQRSSRGRASPRRRDNSGR
jgi:ribosomal protein S18 acetylase RimI-like enzyme